MTIQHTYNFNTAQEAILFAQKYSKIWFITSPIQGQNGWQVIRYITFI